MKMENTESNEELLENVTISDVGGSQYMIQRMAVDNTQLINAELLTQHGGLVVDLGGNDFIPVNYTSEDLLNQDLTEEDRNLAAALVAVQLSQQQKQQQLQQDSSNVVINQSLPGLVTNTSLVPGVPKVELSEQQLILAEKTANALNTRYLQIVENENIYETYDEHIKSEDDTDTQMNPKDSDGENRSTFRSDNRSSRKSLPHKKRISRKLKKSCGLSLRKVHKCTLCEQTFSTEDFVQHQSVCHTTITPVNPTLFSCQLCQSNFQDQLSFFEHLKSHYEPSIQVEPTEVIEDDNKEGIRIDSDTPKDSLLSSLLSLHCIGCNKTFRRQKTYEAHVREIHSKVELTEFSEPEDLMAGIDVVVATNEQSSEDDSKSWSKYRDEELHATEEDLRELEAQDHVCHICNEPFPMRAILLQHLITCRSSNDQGENNITNVPKKKQKKKTGELNCTDCDRVFAHRNSLVYHMRSHTGDRPHQCEHCGKSFFAASALKVHMRLHSGDKPYKCEHCGRNFRQWGDLKYHTISLHSDQKQYQCEYCGKDFARKYSLIVHRRIHTGERNYKCEFCGKSFRASSYLQNHRRIHTGEKPHPCEVCGKPFRVRSDMKRHMKTHGRRRMTRPAQLSPELVVTKVEKSYSRDKMVDSDDTSQNQTQENESAVQALQYEQSPLEAVRDGNTLYTNGHQLFVLYTSGTQMKSIEAGSNWSQSS